jgi:hypothetical protein
MARPAQADAVRLASAVGGRRAQSRCGGVTGGGSPVALVGGGGRHKLEGTTEHALCKERGYGAHRGGAAPSRWRSSGGMTGFW